VLLRDIIKNAHGVSIKSDETLAMCKNLELYFERYYRSMLLQSSDDINRCMTHALSHPTDPAFQSLFQHHHSVKCAIMQQDTAFLQQFRADLESRSDGSALGEDIQHMLWQLASYDDLVSKYKAHLLRKTWDREAYKRMLGRLTEHCALVIIDYGQVGWRMMSDFCPVVPCMSVG
jgi:hypothetical protein